MPITSDLSNALKFASSLLLLLYISACSQVYYGALEKVGIHKRDIMVDRVQDAKQSQEDREDQSVGTFHQLSLLFCRVGGAHHLSICLGGHSPPSGPFRGQVSRWVISGPDCEASRRHRGESQYRPFPSRHL